MQRELLADQYVSAGDATEPQVFDSSLLKLHVSVAKLAVRAEDILDCAFHLWEQVDKLDVGWEQQGPRWYWAQVELRVKEIELDQRAEEKEVRMRQTLKDLGQLLLNCFYNWSNFFFSTCIVKLL